MVAVIGKAPLGNHAVFLVRMYGYVGGNAHLLQMFPQGACTVSRVCRQRLRLDGQLPQHVNYRLPVSLAAVRGPARKNEPATLNNDVLLVVQVRSLVPLVGAPTSIGVHLIQRHTTLGVLEVSNSL